MYSFLDGSERSAIALINPITLCFRFLVLTLRTLQKFSALKSVTGSSSTAMKPY